MGLQNQKILFTSLDIWFSALVVILQRFYLHTQVVVTPTTRDEYQSWTNKSFHHCYPKEIKMQQYALIVIP